MGSGVVGRMWEGEGAKEGPGEVDYKEEGECELQYVTILQQTLDGVVAGTSRVVSGRS